MGLWQIRKNRNSGLSKTRTQYRNLRDTTDGMQQVMRNLQTPRHWELVSERYKAHLLMRFQYLTVTSIKKAVFRGVFLGRVVNAGQLFTGVYCLRYQDDDGAPD